MRARALVVSALCFLPSTLLAQDSPFRAGQWAAQFTGGSSFLSLGVIKFKTPARAMLLDVRVAGSHRETFANDSLQGIDSQASFDLRFGWRWYRPAADKVVTLHSLGVQVGFDHFVNASPFFGTQSQNGWDGGPFGELGGVYLITPHFGVGATATALIAYSRVSGESAGGVKSHAWMLRGNTSVSFVATIAF